MGGSSSKSTTTTTKTSTRTSSKGKGRPPAYTLRADAHWDTFEHSVRDGNPKWIPDLGYTTFEEIIQRVENEFLEEFKSTQRKNDPTQDIQVWHVYKSRALYYTLIKKDPTKAEQSWKKAIETCKEAKNPGNELAECIFNLGKFYENTSSQFDKAEDFYKQAIEEIEKFCGKHSDPRVAHYLRAIPDLYVNSLKSKYGQAASLYEHILDLNPIESEELAELCRNLFKCYVVGKLKNKPIEFRGKQAIELTKQFSGEKHALTRNLIMEYNDWASKNGTEQV
jgi:tetratricopeptide (TPR) repeat protein